MQLSETVELLSYQIWANEKLITFLGNLEHEAFIKEAGSSFSSIRDTLVHIIGAEELWLSRWRGEEGRGLLNPADFPNYTVLLDRWINHRKELEVFIGTLEEGDLKKKVSYKNIHGVPYSLELWKQLLHVSNHSSYHRGQINTLIRQVGLTPPSFDLIYYYLGER